MHRPAGTHIPSDRLSGSQHLSFFFFKPMPKKKRSAFYTPKPTFSRSRFASRPEIGVRPSTTRLLGGFLIDPSPRAPGPFVSFCLSPALHPLQLRFVNCPCGRRGREDNEITRFGCAILHRAPHLTISSVLHIVCRDASTFTTGSDILVDG